MPPLALGQQLLRRRTTAMHDIEDALTETNQHHEDDNGRKVLVSGKVEGKQNDHIEDACADHDFVLAKLLDQSLHQQSICHHRQDSRSHQHTDQTAVIQVIFREIVQRQG